MRRLSVDAWDRRRELDDALEMHAFRAARRRRRRESNLLRDARAAAEAIAAEIEARR